VKDLRNLFNPVIHQKALQFNIEIDENIEKEIETDRLRLDQVLRNLYPMQSNLLQKVA
jgi:signal transduction histidine kinase